MACLVKHLSSFFLLTLLSSLLIQARDSQFFNKIPSSNVKNVEKETKAVTPNKDQEPNFIPENENGYGVYGHESGQLPPSATNFEQLSETTTPTFTPTTNLPNSKSLPKNYNPVAYVTVPETENKPHEETNFNSEFTTNPTTSHYSDDNANYYNNNYNQYYSGDTTDEDDDHDNNNNENNQYYSTSGTYNYNQYYNGVSDYNNNNNNQLKTTDYPTKTNTYPYKNGAKSHYNNQEQSYSTNYNSYNGDNGYRMQQQQGISDTRFLENGKYFYDVYTEKNVRVSSYDMHRNRDSYELNNYSNNFVNYEKEGEFRDEQDMP